MISWIRHKHKEFQKENNGSRSKPSVAKKPIKISPSDCSQKIIEVNCYPDWDKMKKYVNFSIFVGVQSKPGYVNKVVGFNRMSPREFKIGPKWTVEKVKNRKWINEYICDPRKKALTPQTAKSPELPPKTKRYLVHDNHSRPFMIAVLPNKRVKVFRTPTEGFGISENDRGKLWTYTKELVNVKPQQIFPGVSPKCEMTKFSGGYGKGTLNNSMLLHLKNNEYMFIGSEIYTFKIPDGDKIVRYTSGIGNNDVPYPAAFGNKNIYFLIEYKYVPIDKLLKPLSKEAKMEPYGEILYKQEHMDRYGTGEHTYTGKAKKISKKIIHKRY